MKMKQLIVISVILEVMTLVVIADGQPVSQVPTFGSMAAGAHRLTVSHSDFVPSCVLSEPGVLKGRWLSSNEVSELRVKLRNEATGNKKGKRVAPFSEDEFTLLIHSGTNTITRNFTAAYGTFRVYGVDLGYGGPDSMVLETGEGRGTFAYVQSLEILAIIDKRFETVLKTNLNGYVWDRTYIWKHVGGNLHLGVEIQLIPPLAIPRFCGYEESLLMLQHPRITFEFNPHRNRFEIKDEDFRTLSE